MGHREKRTGRQERWRARTKKPISEALRPDGGRGFIAGCTVGPKYHRPAVQTPGVFRDLTRTCPSCRLRWRRMRIFPGGRSSRIRQLQELIRTALKQNYDLQLATERINAARAQVTITRSNLFPQLQGNGNFQGGKDSSCPNQIQLLKPDGRRRVSTGLLRQVASRDRGLARSTAGHGRCQANGDVDAGQRCGQRLLRAPAT